MTPTSRRQITACTAPATRIIRRRHRTRGLLYEVGLCHRHRWAGTEWGKTLRPLDEPRPCGLAEDYRHPHEIVTSHWDGWMSSITPRTPAPGSVTEWAAALRAAAADAASLHAAPAVVAALDRAAEAGGGPAAVLLALAEAETAAAAR